MKGAYVLLLLCLSNVANAATVNFLQNGGFETVKTPPSVSPPGFNQLANNVPYWNTTATDGKIELWANGYSNSSKGPVYTVPTYDGFFPNGGKFFAELNATQVSTLYQDVTASKSGSVSFSFWHRGRNANDTMLFQVSAFSGGSWVPIYQEQVTTGPGAWTQYTGKNIAIVKEGTLLRFSYVSISGSTTTIGNFLDNAAFGLLEFPPTDPSGPPPEPDAIIPIVTPDGIEPTVPEAIAEAIKVPILTALTTEGLAFNAAVDDNTFGVFKGSVSLLSQQFYSTRTVRRALPEEDPDPVPVVVDEKAVRDPKEGPGPEYSSNHAVATQDRFRTVERKRWNFWTEASGIYADQKSVSDLPSSYTLSGVFMSGLDYPITPDLSIGLFASYIISDQKFRTAGDGSVFSNGLTYGGYLTYARREGGLFFNLASGGSGFSSSVTRPVTLLTYDLGSASSKQQSSGYFALVETGYDIRAGRFTFGPIASAQYTYLTTGDFYETDDLGLQLHVNSQQQNSLFSGLGGHVNYQIPLTRNIVLIPELRCVWNHEFMNTPRTLTGAIPLAPAYTFSYTDQAIPTNAVSPSAGVTALFGRNCSASLFYNASLWNNLAVQSVNLSASVAF